MSKYCVECHSGEDPKGELNLESYKSLLAGGSHGSALTPGKPDESMLIRLVEGKAKPIMPPRKAAQPSSDEVALLRAWVAGGAVEDHTLVRAALADVKPKNRTPAPVAALAFHPAGRLLAAGGRKQVYFFDDTGSLRWKLAVKAERVTALAFRPDGKLVAVAGSTMGERHEVHLYDFDPAHGPALPSQRMATVHADVIHDMAFSPDGTLLATCGYDRLVKIVEVGSSIKERHVLRDHSDSVYGVAFHPTGKLLATVAADRAVKVWDVATGGRLHTLSEASDWLYCVAWSPDGKNLAAAGVDRSIRVWEVSAAAAKLKQSVFAHSGPITRLAYSMDGQVLYSLSEARSVKAWDTVSLLEKKVYPRQADVPLSVAVQPALPGAASKLAIGRYDGVLVLLDPATGKTMSELLPLRPTPPVLKRILPASISRGQPMRLRLEGDHLEDADSISCTIPGYKAELLPSDTSDHLDLLLTIPATAPAGVYPLSIHTAGGKSEGVPLIVDAFATVSEREPNNSRTTGQKVTLPATVVGVIDRAGDVDYFRFEATAGQEIGAQVVNTASGSRLDPVLQLLDPDGQIVAESGNGLLGYICIRGGVYTLAIRDREYRGESGLQYRLQVGPLPIITNVFPMGIKRGSEADIRLEGVNLGSQHTIHLKAPPDATAGTQLPVTLDTPSGPALGSMSVQVGRFPEVMHEDDPTLLPVPGTGNGRLAVADSSQTWSFQARKGERLLLEVNAQRQRSPLDSVLEILDSRGQLVPRAVLRCLARTYTTFRDHDSTGPGIRIETWDDLAINDYLYAGGELMRIWELPRNPDDDCQFYSLGGKRRGYLGTTPIFHPLGQPLYKVSVHPPGAAFPPNGFPVVTLFYRNDDAGDTYGKDSRMVFDPPADGTYLARILDSRGQGSRQHTYQLTVRAPEPDFRVKLEPLGPGVPAGEATTLKVSAERIDDFDEPIEVHLENLPPGFEAPPTRIPRGEFSTTFALHADPGAKIPSSQPPMEVVARAKIHGKEVARRSPAGLPRLVPPGDLLTTTERTRVVLRPGQQANLTVTIERHNGFKGRVPLEVRGLPHGVRLLNVGLNGILITEKDASRVITLYAEPWAEPTVQPIAVVARQEAKNTEHAARSVLLEIAGR